MVKALGSEWEPNVFIPANKMIQTLDSPAMQPFLREFNITAYGVKVHELSFNIPLNYQLPGSDKCCCGSGRLEFIFNVHLTPKYFFALK